MPFRHRKLVYFIWYFPTSSTHPFNDTNRYETNILYIRLVPAMQCSVSEQWVVTADENWSIHLFATWVQGFMNNIQEQTPTARSLFSLRPWGILYRTKVTTKLSSTTFLISLSFHLFLLNLPSYLFFLSFIFILFLSHHFLYFF